MKKYLFFATALAALASCTSNDFVGEDTSSTTNQSEQAAIAFGTGVNSITRADHVGADAADLLGGKFIVEGFKKDGSDMIEVFNNYYVNWTANTAGKTESNTSDWEYVGTAAAAPSSLPTGAIQSIKYWDYSASQYDFAAYSTGKLAAANVLTTGTPTAGQVLISAITKASTYAGPTYTLKGDVAALKECYISDMVTAYKDNGADPSDYQKEVQLSFRRLASKVRLAFYETIPGYSVKNVYFYQADGSSDGDLDTDISSKTDATLIGTFNKSGQFTVSFPTIGSSNKTATDYNKAHVAFTADATDGTDTKFTFGALTSNYKGAESKETAENVYLGRTSATATYAGTATPFYTDVLPNETSGALELRINYDLLSTDGSGEVITIHGAKAFIPSIYAQWKPNYAYTYIFKISDNTNGWTSQAKADPAGLYPITFDAVVLETEDRTQSTITTVASPSITTYQKGHDVAKNEYAASTSATDSIYVQVMRNSTLANDLSSKGKLYTVSGGAEDPDHNITEADVMDALNINAAGNTTSPVTGRNSWVLTEATAPNAVVHADGGATFGRIPGADGNYISVASGTASRFYAAAGTTYAYVYDTGTDKDDSEIRTAVIFDAKPSNWNDIYNQYYTNEDCSTGAPSDFPTLGSGEKVTYYKKYTNLNKVYGVKIIKIASGS